MRTASSSSVNVSTVSTGPKDSSRTTLIPLRTPPRMVGSKK